MTATEPTTIYPARRVITMNPAFPTADAVAVRGDRVLAVGSVDELAAWGEHTIDARFADNVLMPGFIEAHTHVMAGAMWAFTYVGFFDRRDPNGKVWSGCKNIDDVLERLIEANEALDDPAAPLLAWGLDPIYFDDERLEARHLDSVTEQRPIFVFHASGHLATVNTTLMDSAEITEHTPTPGVALGADGKPNGELQEPPAMALAGSAFGVLARQIGTDEAKWMYGYEARNTGHTLITDLGTSNVNDDKQLANWQRVTGADRYPSRVMVAISNSFGGGGEPSELADLGARLKDESGDMLKFGIVKLILDGSIQGFTARVTWPYYYDAPDGHPGNGLWLIPPEQMADIVTTYHEAGLTVHCHCNGDQATEVFLDAVEAALERHPRWDHRHTVQHCQMSTPAQYERMAAMNMSANIFSNHIFYWGDQHRDITLGPERAARMDACATAERAGVSFAIHSDAPVTPMGALHTAWCAVNRLTASGDVLGPDERISVDSALRAITIDAAYQLKLDHQMGSIESGKYADFAVLNDDPYDVEPAALKDIGVWGTMLGGVAHQAGQG